MDFTGTSGARVLAGVAAGKALTDAVNVGQLNAVVSVASNSVQYDTVDKAGITLGGIASTDGGATNGTKISNIAQGTLSATSTDAVNGAQLNATNQKVASNTDNIGVLAGALGGGAAVNGVGTLSGPTYTLSSVGAGGNVSSASYNNVGAALLALGGSVVNLNQAVENINTGAGLKFVQINSTKSGAIATGVDSTAVGPGALAGGIASVSIGDAASAGGAAAIALGQNAQAGSQGALALGSNALILNADRGTAVGTGTQVTSAGGVAIGAGAVAVREGMKGQLEPYSNVAVASTQGAISVGTVGNERQITNVAGGTQATDAVNVRQLQAVQASGVGYATNADGSVDYQQVVLGNGQAPNGTVLSNVAPGVVPSDAVNVQQLRAGVAAGVGQANAYTDARVSQIQAGMKRVAERANAGVAAAMALESAPYVPGKVSYAAGLGHYESQSAIGVSLRSTSASGRWSVTGGVSATGVGGAAVRFGVAGVFE